MATKPHRPGQVPPTGLPTAGSGQPFLPFASDDLTQAHDQVLPPGLLRRLDCRTVVSGHVTCVVEGAAVLGSAGSPWRADAVATAHDIEAARLQALGKGLSRYAAAFWQADTLSNHPPQPPHGTGPGPWVRMWVGEDRREVWMPAARVYAPFRLGGGRLVGDDEGLACARSLDAARAAAEVQQVRRRAMLPLWQALAREQQRVGAPFGPEQASIDRIVGHAHGLTLAISFQWSAAGPLHGVAGLGCGVDDVQALAQARADRAHTEALLRLQQAGVWGGWAQDCPADLDARLHRLAWDREAALALARLLDAWTAPTQPAVRTAQRTALAWADLTPPLLQAAGWWAVRVLWLDGEGGWISRPAPPSPLH